MSSGELIGREFVTSRLIRICWCDGRIVSCEPLIESTQNVGWILPALFDLQINGYGGIDFQQNALTESDLLTAVSALNRDGCARFLFTLITDQWEILLQRLRHVRDIRSRSVELNTAIAGWHIEGPFLSKKPGFHGTHNPDVMLNPTIDLLKELRETVPDDPILITIAPELPGSIKAIEWAVKSGMVVSIGHTDAPLDVINEAVLAGATAFTHLGNGCPSDLNRHDNILWRIFETQKLVVSVIPDKIHVSPLLFRLIHRVIPPERIIYVTDAMAAGGSPPGTYPLGKLRLAVGPDEVVRQPGYSNYAGSALRPIQAIYRASQMLECPWNALWERYSIQPARLMNIPHSLGPGQEATFIYCIPDPSTPNPNTQSFNKPTNEIVQNFNALKETSRRNVASYPTENVLTTATIQELASIQAGAKSPFEFRVYVRGRALDHPS